MGSYGPLPNLQKPATVPYPNSGKFCALHLPILNVNILPQLTRESVK
jgi:hypothetical protein